MMTHRRALATATIAALMLTPAVAEPDLNSANYLMPACKKFANSDFNVNSLSFLSGVCAGTIGTLMTISSVLHICLPPQVTNGQAVQVVIQYIDAQPARLHENFTLLAIEALREAWPCKK
jgi:hypothetical protein